MNGYGRLLRTLRLHVAQAGILGVAALVSPSVGAQTDQARGAPSAPTESSHAVFARANRLFERAQSENDLRSAVADYDRLLKGGHRNARLYYNLGNTYRRLGENGRAIANFRRALELRPDDGYARAMLEDTRRSIRERMPDLYTKSAEDDVLYTVFVWHFETTLTARLWMLSLSSLAFWLVLSVALYRRFPYYRFLAAGLFVVQVAAGASLSVEALSDRGEDAVIVASEVEVRVGNGPEYDLAIDRPIPSGVEVRVVEARDQWYLVRFPSGDVGWIPARTVEAVS